MPSFPPRLSTPEDRPRLLVVGDGVVPTGFSRVLENLLRPLVSAFEIHHLAVQYQGDPHHLPWKVYPARVEGGPLCGARLCELLHHCRPSALFLLGAPEVLGPYLDHLEGTDRPRTILYCAIDSAPVDPSRILALGRADLLLVFTETARQIVLSAFDEASIDPPEVQILAHGVDPSTFFPYPDDPTAEWVEGRLLAKHSLFPQVNDLATSFVVLNNHRNTLRKRIDLTMDGFARFARGKPPNVRLYLHMNPTAGEGGWDVIRLAEHFGVAERLILSGSGPEHPSVSDAQMNLIYNACDVGLNTSHGEGWGLPAFEHGAARGAQVMTAHPVARELWGEAAELVEPALEVTEPILDVAACLVDPRGVAAALERLYEDRQYLAQRQADAYRRATEGRWAWPLLSEHLRRFLQPEIPTGLLASNPTPVEVTHV